MLNKKNKILFLDTTISYNCVQKVDIILSPQLYWVRILDIPKASKKDILGMVATIFEDFIDTAHYKFYTIKQNNDKYLSFAYNEDDIKVAIKNANLNINQITNMYFAQNELKVVNSFKINNNNFIYQDDILLKIPQELIMPKNDIVDFDVDGINLSKHKIYLNETNSFIDNKSIYIVSGIFFIFFIINIVKIQINENIVNKFLQNQENIKTKYKLLPTKMQTISIIKGLEIKHKQQIKLRKDFKNKINKISSKINTIYLKNGAITYE
jgi:hypothetical protein